MTRFSSTRRAAFSPPDPHPYADPVRSGHPGSSSAAPLRPPGRNHVELGWSRLSNGDLLAAAEGRFDVLITTDRNLRYQQPLAGRKLAVLVLPTTNWPRLQNQVERIATALASLKAGEYLELPG